MSNKDTIPCFECDGTLEVEYQTYITKLNGLEYAIKDVPVHKCDTCGQESYSAEASRVIEAALPERPMRGPRRLKDS
jgi:YgiT-type zinc finger domain-containing protein